MRTLSKLAPKWGNYTTLDKELLDDAASLNEKAIENSATKKAFQKREVILS